MWVFTDPPAPLPEAERQAYMAKATRTQQVLLVFMVLGIILLSAGFTLYLSGSLNMLPADEAAHRYRTVTLTDAQLECEKYAREKLGARIRTLSVDAHSTRFDTLEQRFKVFFIADLYDSDDRKGLSKPYHINCFSRGERATVARFKILEDKDSKPKAIERSEGGVFGWPL